MLVIRWGICSTNESNAARMWTWALLRIAVVSTQPVCTSVKFTLRWNSPFRVGAQWATVSTPEGPGFSFGHVAGDAEHDQVPHQIARPDGRLPADRITLFRGRQVPVDRGGRHRYEFSYAGGMTVRDIQHHLASSIGTDLSHETISKVTDQISEEVLAWQHRPLEALYPVIYLDALVVKVRDSAHVINKAVHIAVGVDMDGVKHVA